ncbi:MAG TPA: hypothetical protein VL727_16770 [Puia sp.]|jgi:hypothetical protein|nr:hypothetical protein [Puia sp.]
MRRKNDQLWKSLLEDVFDDLLRFVFPEAEKALLSGKIPENELLKQKLLVARLNIWQT